MYLVVGFLCSEGILVNRQDLKDITVEEDKGSVYAEVNEYEHKLAGKFF